MKTKLLFIILALSISSSFISCNIGNAKTESPKKIVVTGSAEMEIVPNEIYMTFTLKEYLQSSKKKINLEDIKTEFLELCKEVGVDGRNISISSYAGNENWDYYWYKKHKSDPDFMASISYTIKVNSADTLDKIINNINENAIENFKINKTSHSDIEKLRKDVKTNALIASKTKANYLSKSIDEELGEALLITEIDNSYYSSWGNSNFISNTALDRNSNNSSKPEFQKIKLRYEMKVEFKIK